MPSTTAIVINATEMRKKFQTRYFCKQSSKTFFGECYGYAQAWILGGKKAVGMKSKKELNLTDINELNYSDEIRCGQFAQDLGEQYGAKHNEKFTLENLDRFIAALDNQLNASLGCIISTYGNTLSLGGHATAIKKAFKGNKPYYKYFDSNVGEFHFDNINDFKDFFRYYAERHKDKYNLDFIVVETPTFDVRPQITNPNRVNLIWNDFKYAMRGLFSKEFFKLSIHRALSAITWRIQRFTKLQTNPEPIMKVMENDRIVSFHEVINHPRVPKVNQGPLQLFRSYNSQSTSDTAFTPNVYNDLMASKRPLANLRRS